MKAGSVSGRYVRPAVVLVAAVSCLIPTGIGARSGGEHALVERLSPGALQRPDRDVRSGRVRLEARALADDLGAWNPLGTSLFWALWGERHDPDRLERNLAHLAQHHVDYVRILGMVGGETWADRVIDPNAPGYWDVVDRLFSRLERHGLRAQVTIFAEAGVLMPDTARREAFAAAWADLANGRLDRILLLEVANEAWQNGFEDPADVRRLGDLLRSRTTVPVALSAAAHRQVFRLYGGWPGVATLHHDRDVSGPDGPWRPVWQPWTWPDAFRSREGYDGAIPPVVVNNEPIGPDASVEEDADPVRMALAYVTTFVAGHAAYVYHPGAGIRGGGKADRERGRRANVQDYPAAILNGLAAMRARLPAGLANWTRHDVGALPWDGSQAAIDRGDIVGAHAATRGEDIVGVVLGIRRPHAIAARRAINLVLLDPVTGQTRHQVSLAAGQRWTIPADLSGYVVIGTVASGTTATNGFNRSRALPPPRRSSTTITGT